MLSYLINQVRSTSSILLWHFAIYSLMCHCKTKNVDCLWPSKCGLFILIKQIGHSWPSPYIQMTVRTCPSRNIWFHPWSFRSWQGSAMTISLFASNNYSIWEMWKFFNFHGILFLKLIFFIINTMFLLSPWKGYLMERRQWYNVIIIFSISWSRQYQVKIHFTLESSYSRKWLSIWTWI